MKNLMKHLQEQGWNNETALEAQYAYNDALKVMLPYIATVAQDLNDEKHDYVYELKYEIQKWFER